MFCPRCGRADQLPDTYCRQCGLLLPDLSKTIKRERPAEGHLSANTWLSVLTIVASFTLSLLLFVVLGSKPEAHPLIHVTSGLLLAMGGWRIRTFIRTHQLKKQWKRRTPRPEIEAASPERQQVFNAAQTVKLLDEVDPADAIPASVTENTTRHLADAHQAKRL